MEGTLHQFFKKAVQQHPHATAISYQSKLYTYEELDYMTDILGGFLQHYVNIKKNSICGILMEHCPEYIISALAILKAGGAFMPLEIVLPPELLRQILTDFSPLVVFSKSQYKCRFPTFQLTFSMDSDSWLKRITENFPSLTLIDPLSKTDDLAFVVMSSGTTGTPKGICQHHRAALFSYAWRYREYPYEPDDVVASHVFFIWEMLRPLLQGAVLSIIPDDVAFDPAGIAEHIQQERITRILFTPSLLQTVLDTLPQDQITECMKTLRLVWMCGEVVSAQLAKRFLQALPHCKLLNLYSVSECHDVAAAELTLSNLEGRAVATCGKVFEGIKALVMKDGLLLPPGEEGELFVAGPVVARGYLNQPEITAKAFLPHPTDPNVRVYKTGDIATIAHSGELQITGRCDYMVKIRGYSIVLGQVEAAISSHPRVGTSYVVCKGKEGEDKWLAAYISPIVWEDIPSTKTLRQYLSTKIPHYAIPSEFFHLETLPLSESSAKANRESILLQEHMTQVRPSSDTDEENSNPALGTSSPGVIERGVEIIWHETLASKGTLKGSYNFFSYGGHSLSAAIFADKISKKFSAPYKIRHLLTGPHVFEIVDVIRNLLDDQSEDIPTTTHPNLRSEAVLDTTIFPAPTRKSSYSRFRMEMATFPPKRIFLTGATGFFGIHLLQALLKQPSRPLVYCLVRSGTKEDGLKRLLSCAKEHQIDLSANEIQRVQAIVGDLSNPLLGMDTETFGLMAQEIDVIVHNGAMVNLFLPYSSLKAANVLGTQEALRLAVTNASYETKVKPFHYISTNAVFPQSYLEMKEDMMLEEVSDELVDGYAQSKWVAEQIVIQARKKGLPVALYRPGNLGPSTETGIWNRNDFLYLLLWGCIAVGAWPTDTNWKFHITPVDLISQSLGKLICSKSRLSLGQTLHLQNHHPPIEAERFFSMFQKSTTKNLVGLPLDEWKIKCETLQDFGEKGKRFLSGLPAFTHYLAVDASLGCEEFLKCMRKLNSKYHLEMPDIGLEYLKKCSVI